MPAATCSAPEQFFALDDLLRQVRSEIRRFWL
jgi:hypothetical protein